MVFTEKAFRFSEFIKFDMTSQSAEVPKLSVLRVELERVHPGMSDFIFRASTPKYGNAKSGTVVSVRGTRNFTKYDTVLTLANTICKEMAKRGDETHTWADADQEHLAEMLYNTSKFFAGNPRIERMQFTTEALI